MRDSFILCCLYLPVIYVPPLVCRRAVKNGKVLDLEAWWGQSTHLYFQCRFLPGLYTLRSSLFISKPVHPCLLVFWHSKVLQRHNTFSVRPWFLLHICCLISVIWPLFHLPAASETGSPCYLSLLPPAHPNPFSLL